MLVTKVLQLNTYRRKFSEKTQGGSSLLPKTGLLEFGWSCTTKIPLCSQKHAWLFSINPFKITSGLCIVRVDVVSIGMVRDSVSRDHAAQWSGVEGENQRT